MAPAFELNVSDGFCTKEHLEALTDLVLAICRCSKNSIPNSTFSISRPRIAFIRESALKNARALDFLAFWFLPNGKIRLRGLEIENVLPVPSFLLHLQIASTKSVSAPT